MANKYRGETELIICGRTYVMRPTFEMLVEFEEKSGISAYDAIRLAVVNQSFSVKAIASAFHAGIKAGWKQGDPRPPSFGEIGALVIREGMEKMVPIYVRFLTNALSSDEDIKRAEEEQTKGKELETNQSQGNPLPPG